jgi:hypothetical protein
VQPRATPRHDRFGPTSGGRASGAGRTPPSMRTPGGRTRRRTPAARTSLPIFPGSQDPLSKIFLRNSRSRAYAFLSAVSMQLRSSKKLHDCTTDEVHAELRDRMKKDDMVVKVVPFDDPHPPSMS